MRKISKIVVHHSGNTDSVEGIKDLHVNKNGWDGIGYHFMIGREGAVFIGRALDAVGAHAKGHNKESIGICLLGNFDEEEPYEPQMDALVRLMSELMEDSHLGPDCIILHRELNSDKSCPGTNITKEMILCKLQQPA